MRARHAVLHTNLAFLLAIRVNSCTPASPVQAPEGSAPPPIAETPAPPAPAPDVPPVAGDIACGAQFCGASQACCEYSVGETACVAKSAEGDESSGSPAQRVSAIVKTRGAACKTARKDPLEAVSLCTSSRQCATGSLCCQHWDEDAGVNVSLCQATPACPEDEHCVHGTRCSTPGSVCVLGLCAKPGVSLECDGHRCEAGQVCCSGPKRCTSPAECAKSQGTAPHRALHFACNSPADCPRGMVCVGTATISSCRAKWQPDADGLQKLRCEADAHCAPLRCPKDTRATCEVRVDEKRCRCVMETPTAPKP